MIGRKEYFDRHLAKHLETDDKFDASSLTKTARTWLKHVSGSLPKSDDDNIGLPKIYPARSSRKIKAFFERLIETISEADYDLPTNIQLKKIIQPCCRASRDDIRRLRKDYYPEEYKAPGNTRARKLPDEDLESLAKLIWREISNR